MANIGLETSFIILFMNYLVYGLPVSMKEFIAEQIVPPLNPLTESQITASHFKRSSGS